MSREIEYIPFECAVLAETEKAFRLEVEGETTLWVPKSVIEDAHLDVEVGETNCEICIAEWFAKKEGLI